MNSPIFHSSVPSSLNAVSEALSLWAVGERKRSGLIFCKAHYADFAGPGALITGPVEQSYSMIVSIGTPEMVEVTTHEARQRAYSSRIQWGRWLNKIVSHPDPSQRVEKLFSGFEAFFGDHVIAGLSDDVLGLLAGVLPHTVATLRQSRHRLHHWQMADCEPLNIKTWDVTPRWQAYLGVKPPEAVSQELAVAPCLQRLPCSA